MSLLVSCSAVALAALVGLPLGGWLALGRFPGRRFCVLLAESLMGLPPVVVGLAVYLVLAPAGYAFTPQAMVLAQFLVVVPILTALTRQVVTDLDEEYHEQLRSLGVSRVRAIPTPAARRPRAGWSRPGSPVSGARSARWVPC